MTRAHLAERALGAALGFAANGVWLLVGNCLQNLLRAPRAVAGVGLPPVCPKVSVLIPARDEAANIGACVGGLLDQTYPNLEIIVCDDRSTDGTAAIVRALAEGRGAGRLRLLAGRPMPEGWSGKNWACQQLSEAASGEWLLFTDADTRHAPGAVAAAMALALARDADLLSLLPRQVTGSLGERLLVTQLPLIVFAILPIRLVASRARWARPFAGANGLYLLFRREWHDALGGYGWVRGVIAEDMRFAIETKRRGGRLVLADGSAVLTCRMYDGFGDAWRGCSRNAFSAALDSGAIFALFTLVWAALFALPPLALLALGAVGRPSPPPPAGGDPSPHLGRGVGGAPPLFAKRDAGDRRAVLLRLALRATIGQSVARLLVGWRQGRPAWEAGLQPLSSLLTLGVLLNSYRLHRLGGGYQWRGRRYA